MKSDRISSVSSLSTSAVPDAAGLEAWLADLVPASHGNFIGGEWVAGQGRTSITNPGRKSQRLGEFAQATPEDVSSAVNAAAAASESWGRTPAPQRAAMLFRLADLIEVNLLDLAYTVSAEQGKVIAEGLGEVRRSVAELRYSAGEALRSTGETIPSEKASGLVASFREPLGVVAAIAPWNFPLLTPLRKLGPALAFGCTVVLKPSELTPWSVVRLMQLTQDVGFPPGIVNMITGTGRIAGQALVGNPLVRGVSFTGSTAVGKSISAQIATRLARQQLELGGKNPAVVLSYKDVDFVAGQIVSAALACSGQRCTSISRVIVIESLVDELTEALAGRMAAIRLGPAWDLGATMGPLIDKAQFEKVVGYLDIGRREGARVRFGGHALSGNQYDNGYYVQPTLFDRATPDMRIAREEIFGPVITVIAVRDFEEAIIASNSVAYGLGSCIFTTDVDEALGFVRRSESGMVHINHGTASEAHVPFGGVKDSGAGAFSIGHSNQEFFTTLKVAYAQMR